MNIEDLESLSSGDRESLANAARRDLYFMARGVLRYRKLVPHVHLEPTRFLSAPPHRDFGHLAPRDHYKTTVGIAHNIQDICKDSGIRILKVNESSENSKAMLRQIQWHFESNRFFRFLFPELIPKKFRDTMWNSESMVVPRDVPWSEPTVTAVGTGTKVVSRHFDLIDFDDMIGLEHKNSPTLMKAALEYLKYSISLLVEPEESRRVIRGTRWKHDDVYQYAMDKMGFVFLRQKAVVMGANGPEPLFPELISMRTLRQIIEQDPEQYAANYANDPFDADNASFRAEWLNYYTVGPDRQMRFKDENGTLHIVDPNKMLVYCHFDPALGDDTSNDPVAAIVVGIIPGPRVFVLEAFKKHITPIEQVNKLIQIQETFVPNLFTIESVGYQRALRYFLQQEARRRGVYLRVEDSKPERNKSKQQRIRARLQPLFRTGSIYIRSDQTDFLEEYLRFGMTEQDHLMDALAQGPPVWREPWNEHQIARRAKQQEELMQGRGITGYGI